MNFDFELDPFENFSKSIHQAKLQSELMGLENHNAMALTTVNDKQPSSRMVLFRGLVRRGFSFYTHYDGRKGSEIKKNNHVAAVFYWPYLDHQINIQGKAIPLTALESDDYFKTRSRSSQIGAWASQQSEVLNSRFEFELQFKFFENKFANQMVPRPSEWGGFHIIPHEIEFWFDAPSRLHYRYVYQLVGEHWKKFMRYP